MELSTKKTIFHCYFDRSAKLTIKFNWWRRKCCFFFSLVARHWGRRFKPIGFCLSYNIFRCYSLDMGTFIFLFSNNHIPMEYQSRGVAFSICFRFVPQESYYKSKVRRNKNVDQVQGPIGWLCHLKRS